MDPPGELFGHDPAPELPKYTTMMMMSRGLITSGMLLSGGPSQETAPINTPIMNEDKHQPVMPTPAPIGALIQPIEKEKEKEKEKERVIQPLESKQQNETNKNRAELTPEQPANPYSDQNKEIDTMDVDHHDYEIECEDNERPSTV